MFYNKISNKFFIKSSLYEDGKLAGVPLGILSEAIKLYSFDVDFQRDIQKNDEFDYYTISFGLRNTKNLKQSITEAYRVLKPGGRYLCLEFSKIQNSNLELLYKYYSKIIPHIGKAIVGEKEPYEYLTKSIDEFVNQDELIDLMKQNKFENCSYRNLSGGIVAIHSGWKI